MSAPWLSRIFASTSGIAASPIGTFTQKIHCQSMPSTTAPPTSGPLATAMPVIALKIPIAAPRLGGNAALSSARPSGRISAAPAPCSARAAISTPTFGASAHGRRGEGEQPEPGGVELAATVAVAERRRGDQQHGEAQVVGVDGPLELPDRGVESSRIRLSAVDTTSVSTAAMNEPMAVSTTVYPPLSAHMSRDPASDGNPSLVVRVHRPPRVRHRLRADGAVRRAAPAPSLS